MITCASTAAHIGSEKNNVASSLCRCTHPFAKFSLLVRRPRGEDGRARNNTRDCCTAPATRIASSLWLLYSQDEHFSAPDTQSKSHDEVRSRRELF